MFSSRVYVEELDFKNYNTSLGSLEIEYLMDQQTGWLLNLFDFCQPEFHKNKRIVILLK